MRTSKFPVFLSLFHHGCPCLIIVPKARLVWKGRVGPVVLSYFPTRWLSQWKLLHEVMVFFGDLELFHDYVDTTQQLLTNFVKSLHATKKNEFEIAILINAGKYFVEARYQLENALRLAMQSSLQVGTHSNKL